MKDPIRRAAYRALESTGKYRDVALAMKERFGWRGSEQAARSRLSQMLSTKHPHHLPADALLDIVRITGIDEFSSLIMREAAKAEVEED